MGKNRINDNVINDIENSFKKNFNDNDRRKNRVYRVDSIADYLVRKFKAPNSRPFFCKCAWNMSEDEIWTIYEKAHAPKIEKPLKYFIACCSTKMER